MKLIVLIAAILLRASLAHALPAWVEKLPLWQWYEIPNTALSSVPPSVVTFGPPYCKIDCWNGAALKRQGSVYIIGASGGHSDYAGNEVNAITLNSEAPTWTEVAPPSPTTQIINASAFYLDMRAGVPHTYYGLQFINATNRLYLIGNPGLGMAGVPMADGTQPWHKTPDRWSVSFNFSTNTWDAPSYIQMLPGGGDWTASFTVKHPITEDIYHSRGQGWWKLSATTRLWELVSNNSESNYAGGAIDPINSRMLIVGAYSAILPRVRDLNGNVIPATFTGLGAGVLTLGSNTKGYYPTVVYDEINRKFLVIYNDCQGTNWECFEGQGRKIKIYRVDPVTWFVDEPTVTGTLPEIRTNGTLNAPQYVPELGGVVVANKYTGNLKFIRTSGGGMPTAPNAPTNLIVK